MSHACWTCWAKWVVCILQIVLGGLQNNLRHIYSEVSPTELKISDIKLTLVCKAGTVYIHSKKTEVLWNRQKVLRIFGRWGTFLNNMGENQTISCNPELGEIWLTFTDLSCHRIWPKAGIFLCPFLLLSLTATFISAPNWQNELPVKSFPSLSDAHPQVKTNELLYFIIYWKWLVLISLV